MPKRPDTLANERPTEADSSSIAAVFDVHCILSGNALNQGTDDQRQRWLRKIVSGEIVGAFATTEPDKVLGTIREIAVNTCRAHGAKVQRPLWASTSTKNPDYPDTLYVDELIGPDTVNTMPMPTLHACAEQLEVTPGTAEQDPSAELEALADAGIDVSDVTDTLLREGIDKFIAPYDALVQSIESTREGIVTGRPPTIRSSIPDDLERPLVERMKQAEAEGVAKRVWQKDESLWGGPGVPEIANRLGWLTISEKMLEQAPALTAFVEQVKSA